MENFWVDLAPGDLSAIVSIPPILSSSAMAFSKATTSSGFIFSSYSAPSGVTMIALNPDALSCKVCSSIVVDPPTSGISDLIRLSPLMKLALSLSFVKDEFFVSAVCAVGAAIKNDKHSAVETFMMRSFY